MMGIQKKNVLSDLSSPIKLIQLIKVRGSGGLNISVGQGWRVLPGVPGC